MTITTAPTTPLADGWQACGCGEDKIPGLLARVGFYGTLGLGLATLILMIAAGWLLGTAVWLLRRRRNRSLPPEESARVGLAGFTWTADEERPASFTAPPTPPGR
ncbi:hypothetical protein SAMN06272735_5390 [Streptomyces sp. TLI_55]|uniref:hypothetical protein n=1 Tax=Streptomyces sp. TLI_55 TaxID=1938861 RepID=UPI000BCD4168|nr:hypothetical protein [Streptomyces sp. TLI_55]SNX63580.1 hypothetical protein SAMN06272735_5390 [Streptomyces sp. TLI_55]